MYSPYASVAGTDHPSASPDLPSTDHTLSSSSNASERIMSSVHNVAPSPIFRSVIELLPRQDLWNFAQTSFGNSKYAREKLYRHPYFASTQSMAMFYTYVYDVLMPVPDTLQVNSRLWGISPRYYSTRFARCVKKVTIYTDPRDEGFDQFPFEVLSPLYWPHLESVELIGSPFDTKTGAALQSAFEKYFAETRSGNAAPTALKSFTFRAFDDAAFPYRTLRLPLGLERVEISRMTDAFPFAVAKGIACSASPNSPARTITHLSLKGSFDPNHATFLEVLRGRFSALTSFEIGNPSAAPNMEATNHITAFLIDHRRLVRLSLASTWNPPLATCEQGNKKRIPAPAMHLNREKIADVNGFLPTLSEFEGTAFQLMTLLYWGVPSFFHLTKLSLVCPPQGHCGTRDILSKYPHWALNDVRSLTLNFLPDLSQAQMRTRGELGHGQTSLILKDCIDRFSSLCPQVTYLRAKLPTMNVDELSQLLVLFDSMRVLDLPIRVLQPFFGRRELRSLDTLGRTHRELEFIIARAPDYSDIRNRVLTVRRPVLQTFPVERTGVVISELRDVEGLPISEWEAGYM